MQCVSIHIVEVIVRNSLSFWRGRGERLLALLLFLPCLVFAQEQRIFDEMVRTLTVVVDNDPTLPPVMAKGAHRHLHIGWDEMSHEPQRYIYHIQHCSADWTPTDELFSSDYIGGLNDQLVEDYETSFNTTQLYTHYALTLPNRQTSILLSGNYRVQIFHEDDDVESDTPVLEAQFCVYENEAGIRMELSSNTDVDFNKTHQQVSFAVNYGNLVVVDPAREIKTRVMQNRRMDNAVEPQPNIRSARGIEFTHNRQLIFPAGNEYSHFEILDVHRTAQGVEQMQWFDPYYHASLYVEERPGSYSYHEDQNGVYVLRSADDRDDATTAEYVVVHFLLDSPRLPDDDVYVCGLWTGQAYHPDCRMEYDELAHQYHAAILLKQGYYSYQFRQSNGATFHTVGDFYETENEYSVFVYYRGQGARYDRLVGYNRAKTR